MTIPASINTRKGLSALPGNRTVCTGRTPTEHLEARSVKRLPKALAEGYTLEKNTAYHGYYFKILKGQGPDAPLGSLDYVIQGAMIGGFALVAVPAEYRVTGVKTFMVGPNGVVYQKDLGPTR